MFILKKGHQPGVYVPLRALFLVSSTEGWTWSETQKTGFLVTWFICDVYKFTTLYKCLVEKSNNNKKESISQQNIDHRNRLLCNPGINSDNGTDNGHIL